MTHRFKEPEAAYDRMKRCFVYGSAGIVANANATIETTAAVPLDNYDAVLDPEYLMKRATDTPGTIDVPTILRSTPPEEIELAMAHQRSRASEVPQDHTKRKQIASRVTAARIAGRIIEQLRRVTVEEALEMLG